MATFRIKRRLYSDDNQNQGMNTGAKIGLGIGAAATLAGGVMAGRAGMLGSGIQKQIGNATGYLGKTFKNQKLVNDAVNTIGKSRQTSAMAELGGKKGLLGMNTADKGAAISLVKEEKNNAMNIAKNKFQFNTTTPAAPVS